MNKLYLIYLIEVRMSFRTSLSCALFMFFIIGIPSFLNLIEEKINDITDVYHYEILSCRKKRMTEY